MHVESPVQPEESSASSTATTEPTAADLFLWHHACEVVSRPCRFVPGHTEVVERCQALPSGDTFTRHFGIRIRPDALGRAFVSSIPHGDSPDQPTTSRLPRLARQLLDQTEDLVRHAHPLRHFDVRHLRRLSRHGARGPRCTIFRAEKTAGDLEFEFRIWIDATIGQARRIEYHARAARAVTDRLAIASAHGAVRYRTDTAGQWFPVEETIRLSFWSPFAELPPRGTAERTTTFGEHWQPGYGC